MMLTETERNEQKKFKLQQGGCSSNQGVCRNKKVGLQKTCWAWCTGWVGSNWVGPRRTDPIGEVYMGCKPIFLHFHPLFLSLLPFFSVLSPQISSSSPMGVGWRRGGRPPCQTAAAPPEFLTTPFFYFFLVSNRLLSLYSILNPKIPKEKATTLDLKKRKTRILPLLFLNRDCMDSFVTVGFGSVAGCL